MAIVLTAAVVIPNAQRAVLQRIGFFENAVKMEWEIRNVASNRTKKFDVWARNAVDNAPANNAKCDVLQINPTPTGFDDDIRVNGSSLTSATAADQIDTAFVGANRAAKLRSVEQKCLDLGIVTLVGTVS
jgi:hypothetical protein